MPGEQSREAVKQKPAWKVIAFRKTQFTEELLASKAAPFRCLGAGRDAKDPFWRQNFFHIFFARQMADLPVSQYPLIA